MTTRSSPPSSTPSTASSSTRDLTDNAFTTEGRRFPWRVMEAGTFGFGVLARGVLP
ncbi:MAG: hypothetical protein R3B70_40630 [Polyangiaceae bacterium]